MSSRRDKSFVVFAMVATTLFLMGCSLFETADSVGVEKMREEERLRLEELAKDEEDREQTKAEPDQVLASGDVLSVRVNYGESAASQCQVRIDNDRNGWYDEVENWVDDGSPLGSIGQGRDDYRFGAQNFNKQLTQSEHYDPADAEGEYRVTVSANDGYNTVVKVHWDGEKFSPSLLAFSLD
ncbi:MAG: hypothetical protein LLG08_03455 [Actinomycetia bacterium]|nr:hypothetical protein [Actinomycetes bacterium]